MFKKGFFLTIIFLLIFSLGGFAADYTFTQQSGVGYFVGSPDKADALEDENEIRTIVNDLGTLLGHSKMDGLYPKDLTTGGYLGRLNSGLDASKPAVPVVNDMYLATDTTKVYKCFVAGNWVQIYPDAGKQPLDTALTNISALAYVSPSLIKLTANDTYAVRTLAEIKTDLALNNVDNTSDASKPVSTAGQTALDLKANIASPTFTGTVTAPTILQTNAVENTSKLLQTEDIFSDYVVTGLLPATSANLISDISAGHAYVTGVRVNKAATSNTYTASVDTYVDVNSAGTYTFPEVALGAAAPAVTADSIRLAKVVTNATAITGVTDLRQLISALTNKTYNGLTPTAAAVGFTIAGGTTPKTLTLDDNFVASTQLSVIGANTAKVTESTTATAPLVKTTYDISIPAAATTVSGYLSSTDWNTFNGKQAALTFGIADTNKVQINAADVADDDYAKFTATGLEGRSYAEVKTDLSLNYVENLKVKLDGTAAPAAATDDVTLGYAVGSRWFDVTNDKEYVCLDNADGAAVWTETTGAGGGASTFLELTDTPAAYDDGKYAKSTAAGVVWDDPAGAGDMLKTTYDTDADDIVDKAETVDDGAGNSSTAADVKDAVTKKHTQNTDTAAGGEWDFGAYSAGFTLQEFTAVDGTTTIDWTLGNKYEFTFDNENQAFTFTPPTNAQNMMLWLIQDVTGSRTITWPNTCRWPGGVEGVLSTAGGSVDVVGIAWNGTNYDCVINNAFAVPE